MGEIEGDIVRNKMNTRIIGTMSFAVLLMLTQPVFSAPSLINYQGVLTNMSGRAVTGPVTMTFEIFNAEENGSSVWSETHNGVTLQDGVYNVLLGSVNTGTLTSSVFGDDVRWLAVTVNGELLTPRQRLTSVAYAHNANLLNGMDSTSFATTTDLQTNGSSNIHWGNITNLPTGLNDGDNDTHGTNMWTDGSGQVTTTGNVGVGTTSPSTKLDVNGNINASGSYQLNGTTVILAGPWLNTIVGRDAGNTGSGSNSNQQNTAVGYSSLPSNTGSSHNTAVGTETLSGLSSGAGLNVAVGAYAGYLNTSGDRNVYIGAGAGRGNISYSASDNIMIGAGAGAQETGSSKLYIENSNSSSPLIGGDFSTDQIYLNGNVGIGTTSPNVKLELSGVNSNIRMYESGGSPYIEIGDDSTAKAYLQWFSSTEMMLLYTSAHAYPVAIGPTGPGGVFVDTEANGGNVGIGTTTPVGKLDVNGAIYQRGGQLHADYVFEDNYKLESIKEHSDFMWSEKHLSSIPKAQLDENGVEVVEIGSHRKGIVEELEKAHIYIFQLSNEIRELKTMRVENMALEASNKTLEERTTSLQALVCLDHPKAEICQNN